MSDGSLPAFAIIPDGEQQPAAVFRELDDAMTWGLDRFGANRFRVCHVPVLVCEREGGPARTTGN